VIYKNITPFAKLLICRWYHKNLKFSENRNLFDNYISDVFTVSEKMRAQDTWFLLQVSAIGVMCGSVEGTTSC
jgi:hypothetical protein